VRIRDAGVQNYRFFSNPATFGYKTFVLRCIFRPYSEDFLLFSGVIIPLRRDLGNMAMFFGGLRSGRKDSMADNIMQPAMFVNYFLNVRCCGSRFLVSLHARTTDEQKKAFLQTSRVSGT
jgi:hypothetical protein